MAMNGYQSMLFVTKATLSRYVCQLRHKYVSLTFNVDIWRKIKRSDANTQVPTCLSLSTKKPDE